VRETLPRGFAANGPAVIEDYGSTIVVEPEDRFVVGSLGEITIHCD
jgi:N-methylhydantoinase A